MKYSMPECLSCKFIKKIPSKFGEIAKCTKYPKGIPSSIYPEGRKCTKK